MLLDVFNANNACVKKSPGDGNCLFHSIANSHEKLPTAKKLRKAYSDAIVCCPKVFRGFCRQNDIWTLTNKQASQVARLQSFLPSNDCITFLAESLKVKIFVVACTNYDLTGFNEVFIYEPSQSTAICIVILMNLNTFHYDLITVLDQTVFRETHPFIRDLYKCANYVALKVSGGLLDRRSNATKLNKINVLK
jgi:hypothetical protein